MASSFTGCWKVVLSGGGDIALGSLTQAVSWTIIQSCSRSFSMYPTMSKFERCCMVHCILKCYVANRKALILHHYVSEPLYSGYHWGGGGERGGGCCWINELTMSSPYVLSSIIFRTMCPPFLYFGYSTAYLFSPFLVTACLLPRFSL